MATNLINMLLSWAGLFMLFAAHTTANPIQVNSGLMPQHNISAAVTENRCGLFNTADRYDIKTAIGQAFTSVWPYFPDPCATPARTCRKIVCRNTSAVYICNDNDHDVNPTCTDVAAEAMKIVDNCCGGGSYKAGLSGQRFTEAGYNVVVAFGNCQHGIDSDNPGMGPAEDPWGPNGSCFPH
ncbi:hypothetical protein QBC39DRAFT_369334 [Podospora conica]|nr:hypothetical protein QBC39DRAFT_369334 [Schizothecium conicum]